VPLISIPPPSLPPCKLPHLVASHSRAVSGGVAPLVQRSKSRSLFSLCARIAHFL
jgi:hypothetical protein